MNLEFHLNLHLSSCGRCTTFTVVGVRDQYIGVALLYIPDFPSALLRGELGKG